MRIAVPNLDLCELILKVNLNEFHYYITQQFLNQHPNHVVYTDLNHFTIFIICYSHFERFTITNHRWRV